MIIKLERHANVLMCKMLNVADQNHLRGGLEQSAGSSPAGRQVVKAIAGSEFTPTFQT